MTGKGGLAHLGAHNRGCSLAKQTAAKRPGRPARGPGGAVARRKVLYIHGFDPRGPGPYHSLFVEEAARAAALSGRPITVGARGRGEGGAAVWTVEAGSGADRVETSYALLRWDDRVRARWTRSEILLLGELWMWVAAWARAGFYGVARREARALWMAMLSTPIATGLYLLSALLVISVLGFLAGALAHTLGLPAWVGAGPALLSLVFAAPIWRKLEEKLNLCWLSRCFTFMRREAQSRSIDLVDRNRGFAELIAAAVADPAHDEVLVVGHSLGVLHAVSALARALDDDPGLGKDGRLALLTLGTPIAAFTTLPGAGAFRDELEVVARASQVPWLDVTSPSDPASTCSLDTLRDIEFSAPGRPVQRTPRFHVFLTAAHFRAIRRDPITFHFEYLRAPDIAGGFDYFDMVAGPARLMDHPWVRGGG